MFRNRNKMESQKFSQTQYKIVYLDFLPFTFYNKFDETYQFIPRNKAYYVKGQDFSKFFFKTVFFMF